MQGCRRNNRSIPLPHRGDPDVHEGNTTSNLIVAKFDNQFAAASAFDKLMSRGLPRRKGVVQCDESVGLSAASASAPTTVVSRVSHRGEREGEKHHLRAPDV